MNLDAEFIRAVGVTLDIVVQDESQVADARRRIAAFAHPLSFDDCGHGNVAIIVTEMATNLLRHGRGGHLLCRILPDGVGLEVIAADGGPGMSNIHECLRDGFSTNGTAGNGLGAIRRLAAVFDLFSAPDMGAVILAHVHARPGVVRPKEHFACGAICKAVEGETQSGDRWMATANGTRMRIIIADGLGHGIDAAEAALLALHSASANTQLPPAQILEGAHRAIASSRGAAMAVCDIDSSQGQVIYCGTGNIAGVLISGGQQRSMISHNGIVGHQQRKIQEFRYPWGRNDMLIMHSDGLQSRWSLDKYPGLQNRHPGVIAAVLQRDFSRGRDDVSIVVIKEDR